MLGQRINIRDEWSVKKDSSLPMKIKHNDGSEITITDNKNVLGTYGLEYELDGASNSAIYLDDNHYHKSFNDEEILKKRVEDIMKNHNQRNSL
jgi:hypothetical protein